MAGRIPAFYPFLTILLIGELEVQRAEMGVEDEEEAIVLERFVVLTDAVEPVPV